VPVAAMSSSKKLTLGSKPAVLIDNIMICGGLHKRSYPRHADCRNLHAFRKDLDESSFGGVFYGRHRRTGPFRLPGRDRVISMHY
jgi:hypothetical protein